MTAREANNAGNPQQRRPVFQDRATTHLRPSKVLDRTLHICRGLMKVRCEVLLRPYTAVAQPTSALLSPPDSKVKVQE